MYITESKPSPCPNCLKKDGVMCSNDWGHWYLCCSDECGREFGLRLAKSPKSRQIQRLKIEIARLEREIGEGKL